MEQKEIFNKFPIGKVFQYGVALGFIKRKVHLSQNLADEDTYYCAFILSTRTSEDKHTELHCYLTGDEAYSFANDFQQYDMIQIFFEINHTWEWKSRTTANRVHVLGWAGFKSLDGLGEIPPMNDDEFEFIQKMLKVYRDQTPLPSENEVYVWKAIKNKWPKDKHKKVLNKDAVPKRTEKILGDNNGKK